MYAPFDSVLRLFVFMMNATLFRHAGLVRQLVLSLRFEDVCRWPVFEYVRGASTKKEASSLLFEFVKIYEDINPRADLDLLFKSEASLRRYRNWAKVAYNSGHSFSYSESSSVLSS